MSGGVCGACGVGVPDNDDYCNVCGAALDEFDAAAVGGDVVAMPVVASGPGQKAVIVVAVVLVGLMGVSLAISRQSPEGPSVLNVPSTSTVPSTSSVPSTSTAPTTAEPAGAAPPNTGATPVTTSPRTSATDQTASNDPVDVSILPEFAASHLAVSGRGAIQFLDLQTGEWSRVDLQSDVVDMQPFGGGVVATLPSGALVFATPSSDEPTRLTEPDPSSRVVGVASSLVYISDGDLQTRVRAFEQDGTLAWTFGLPDRGYVVGVASRNRIVVQVDQWVAIADAAARATTKLTAGRALAVSDELVLVTACSSDLDCGIDEIDLDSGRRTRVANGVEWLGPTDVGPMVLNWSLGVFELVHGRRSVGTALREFPCGVNLTAVEAAGSSVQWCGDRLEFLEFGRQIADLGKPFDGCCSSVVLTGRPPA